MYLLAALLIFALYTIITVLYYVVRKQKNKLISSKTISGTRGIYRDMLKGYGYELDESKNEFGYSRKTKLFNITFNDDDDILVFANRSKKIFLYNKFKDSKVKGLIYVLFSLPVIMSISCIVLGFAQFMDELTGVKNIFLISSIITFALFLVIAVCLNNYEKTLNDEFSIFINGYLSREQCDDKGELINATDSYFLGNYLLSYFRVFIYILEAL